MSRSQLVGVALTCVFATAGAQAAAVQQPAASAQPFAEIHVVVRADSGPLAQAQVIVAGNTTHTNAEGRTTLRLAPGPVDITIVKEGFNPVTITATAVLGQSQESPITLERQSAIEEHVTVSATRTDKGIEDQPMRAEVLDAEEIEEKQLMTPGRHRDDAERNGRPTCSGNVTVTGRRECPGSGYAGAIYAVLVRRSAALWHRRRRARPAQIPPDLGQVEVIKGVASALYGRGARRRRRSDLASADEGAGP